MANLYWCSPTKTRVDAILSNGGRLQYQPRTIDSKGRLAALMLANSASEIRGLGMSKEYKDRVEMDHKAKDVGCEG
jgi:hypothetical protein